MAYKTSRGYKRKIYSESSNSTLKIYINDTEINNDYVRDISLNDDVFEEEYFTLGSAIPQSITLKIDNDCLPCKVEEVKNIRIVYGLEVYENNLLSYNDEQVLFNGNELYIEDKNKKSMEWIPIGFYDIGKEPDTSYSDYTTFTLYDYMNRFDIEYDASPIIPCTRYELVKDMCSKCNVELGSESFLNGNIMVNSYDNTIKAKSYLSFISERAGGFAKIGRDGKLYIKSFSDVDVIEMTEDNSASASLTDFDALKTITKLIYEDATRKYEFGTNDGLTVFLSSDSPLVIDEEEVQSIYGSIYGLSFQSVDLKIWSDPAYDTGDMINVIGLKTFIQKRWSYNNGFYGSYKTTLKDSGKKSNVEKISSSRKIKAVKTTLNEITGEIDIISKEINNHEESLAEIKANVSNISLRVENTAQNLENNYLDKEQIDSISSTNNENIDLLRKAVEETISSTQLQINVIKENISNGATKIKTNTGYTFDDEGMKIAKDGEEMSSITTNKGFFVNRDEEEMLGADNTGVRAENLLVRKYLTIGTNSRVEDYKEKRTACFHIGGVK